MTPTTGAAELSKCTAADGTTEVINVPGHPLMVRAVDFNRLHAQVEALSAAQAVATEELALTRQTNLVVARRLQAKIDALNAELVASRKAESQAQTYADDLYSKEQYHADNLADSCGGYGGERI